MREMIDINCHWMPDIYYDKVKKVSKVSLRMFDRAKEIPVMSNLDKRLKMMESFPGYQQIPSLVSPPIENLAGPDQSPDLARIANDAMAEICQKYPEHFPGFVASLPLNNPEASVIEAERAIKSLSAGGIQVFTNRNGQPVDSIEFLNLFDLMVNLNKPVWLHPSRSINHPDYLTEKHSKYEIWWSLGWPYETSAAMARLVFSGIFERLPDLKIITHHVGGFIPMMHGRLGTGMQIMGSRTPADKKYLAENNLKSPPLYYFKKFYADTASFGSAIAIDAGIKFFGVNNLIFATDSPFDFQGGASHIESTIKVIDFLKISSNDINKIYSGNIRRITNIT
jgi:aminocarboxymuconate-semialdehyde decarboxylase